MTQRIVINVQYGGFSLSDAAYEKLIEWGVPVRKYVEEKRGPDGLFLREALNEGEVIFDRELTPLEEDPINDFYHRYKTTPSHVFGRYWETWINRTSRSDPRLVRLVEELGPAANGRCATLKIVEIPDGVEWVIEEYDGMEHVAEAHRTWS